LNDTPITIPMTDGSSVDRFLATVPSFARFGEILDPQPYAALPDDWVVGLADVVSSTQAIEAGHYKNVNMAGAGSLLAVGHLLSDLQRAAHLILCSSGLFGQVSPSNHHSWCEDVLNTKDENRLTACCAA